LRRASLAGGIWAFSRARTSFIWRVEGKVLLRMRWERFCWYLRA